MWAGCKRHRLRQLGKALLVAAGVQVSVPLGEVPVPGSRRRLLAVEDGTGLSVNLNRTACCLRRICAQMIFTSLYGLHAHRKNYEYPPRHQTISLAPQSRRPRATRGTFTRTQLEEESRTANFSDSEGQARTSFSPSSDSDWLIQPRAFVPAPTLERAAGHQQL